MLRKDPDFRVFLQVKITIWIIIILTAEVAGGEAVCQPRGEEERGGDGEQGGGGRGEQD